MWHNKDDVMGSQSERCRKGETQTGNIHSGPWLLRLFIYSGHEGCRQVLAYGEIWSEAGNTQINRREVLWLWYTKEWI